MSKNKLVILIFLFIQIISISLGFLSETSPNDEENIFFPNNNFQTFFIQNMKFSIILASGFFTFGITTLTLLITNGFIIGASIKYALLKGSSISEILIKIIPHGIIEFFGLYCFSIIGFYGIYLLYKFIKEENYKNIIIQSSKETIFLFCIGTIFILLAGIIETFV